MVKEYLKNNYLITDGAMGTYYAQVTGKNATFSEMANITAPDIIRRIHHEYIQAGAKLIRTNTFSANTITLKKPRSYVKEVLARGYEIAKEAANGEDVFIAADIGPVPEVAENNCEIEKNQILDEYRFIIDTFLEAGADIFVFETFSSIDYLADITHYINEKNYNAFILTQFVVMGDGYTRKGISIARIAEEIKKIRSIDAYGFNCGTGPTHLFNNIKKMDFKGDIISALPNAGFPEVINERTVYVQNENYFAERMVEIERLGVKIIGGCCGTTPVHIRKIAEKLEKKNIEINPTKINRIFQTTAESTERGKLHNAFLDKLIKNEFAVAVELDPPFNWDITKMMDGAKLLKENGVDVITVSDSPLGRVRVNSMMMAAKIKREVGIDTIPHICCRDRNIIALKADLLASYVESIRNILIVTGDPIPSAEKSEIKSVFNLNSIQFMELVSEMNKEILAEDPFVLGGALNLNVYNKEVEVKKMNKKIEAGARYFLTQPIYDDEVISYISCLDKPKHIKILAGIMPIVSYKNAQFLNNEIPGIRIPNEYIKQFNDSMTREEAEYTGIQIAVDIAERLKKYVDGFYFITPFNRANIIVEIMKRVL